MARLKEPFLDPAEIVGVSSGAWAHPLDLLAEVDPVRAIAAAYGMASGYRALALRAIQKLAETNVQIKRQRRQIAALRAEVRNLRRPSKTL